MHGFADRLAGGTVAVNDAALEREFEARLVESSTLAFRVAYGVLRHRQDAEDVAQEAFVKAYRSFNQLRDRERFRAWLVRMTWRLALDRQRGDRRRLARETARRKRPRRHVGRSDRPRTCGALVDRDRQSPDKLRIVIVLAGIEGHDTNEVARLLDIPQGDREIAAVSRPAAFEGAVAMDPVNDAATRSA
jgi:RNA polymerase sigma-70 factor (ECF subfamily)